MVPAVMNIIILVPTIIMLPEVKNIILVKTLQVKTVITVPEVNIIIILV